MSPQLTDADIARHDATVGKVLTDADIAARDSNPRGYLSQVGTGLWNTVKGLAQLGVETGDVVFDPWNAVEHLKKLKQMVVDPQVDQAIKAADKWKSGDHSEAVGHALAAVLPGLGPAAANIGEKLGDRDYTGAAADATVLGATMVAPKVAGAIVDAAPVLKGAAEGGYAAAKAPAVLKVRVKGVPVEMNTVPASVAGAVTGATTGAGIGALVGAPGPGAVIGGTVGAAAPVIRGAIRGARARMGPPPIEPWTRPAVSAAEILGQRPTPASFTEPPILATDILGQTDAAPAAAPPVVETPGMALARESGQNWAKLSAADRGMLETVARAKANAAAQPQPFVPPVTPEEAAAPTTQSVGTLEYNAPAAKPVPEPTPAAPEAAPAPKPNAAEIAQQLEASMRAEMLTDYIVRNKIPATMVSEFGPDEWRIVAGQAGVQPPTAENIAAIRDNLAQYEGAATRPPEVGKMSPAEAEADFAQRRDVQTRRKATPAAEPKTDLEAQLAESLAAVESGQRPVAEVPAEAPRAATASEKRVEAYAQHLATDANFANFSPEQIESALLHHSGSQALFAQLGRELDISGAPTAGDIRQIAKRVKELRGAEPGAPAAIIEPDAVQSTSTIGPATGEQSGSEGAPLRGPREPGAPVARGVETTVRVPGEKTTYQGQYTVRELDDVHPSHNAQTFDKNPNYQFRNDRDYSNPVNKERVVVNSRSDTFDPAYVLSDSPDATNGAPVIDSNGNVLGGNSRAMIVDRVYRSNPEGAAAYRAELARRAQQLGIDPQQIAGMKRPVLVRELAESELDPQRAITDLNKTGTASLTAAEQATADARRITPAAADYLTGAIDAEGPESTLNEVLSGPRGVAIVDRLVDDGVFTMQERPKLVDPKTEAVTAAAKERISKMLLGGLFEDADQMNRTPAEVRNKLERTVSPILQSGHKRGFDILPTVREAIDVLEHARTRGITPVDLLAQESLFADAPKFSDDAVNLAQFIKDEKPTNIAKAFRRYVANAEPTMFGKSTPSEAFADAFGTQSPPATLRELMQPEPPAAAKPRPKRRSKPIR